MEECYELLLYFISNGKEMDKNKDYNTKEMDKEFMEKMIADLNGTVALLGDWVHKLEERVMELEKEAHRHKTVEQEKLRELAKV